MNAHARFVGFVIVRADEAHVVRGHDRGAVLRRELKRAVDITLLALALRSLQLDVVAIAEQREPAVQSLARLVLATVDERAAEVAFAGAG